MSGTPVEIFSQRETLAALEIDLPIAVELLGEVQAFIDHVAADEKSQLECLQQRLLEKIKTFDRG
jgi:hypothetical protein